MDHPRIAFLGLGAMGSRMAARLLAAGCQVTVWNRSAGAAAPLVAAGALAAATPREAALGAGIVFAMLRDDVASRAVWTPAEDGALAGLTPGALAIECSTLTVGWVRDLATHAAARGVRFLDAPLAGSRPQAEAGALIFLAGGDAADVARAEPVLRLMGGAVHHAGAQGAGAAVKLAVNALLGVQVAAMAELLGLMRANGVDDARALEIIAATPVCSPAAKAAAGAMLARNFAPLFPVALVEKDFGYLLAAGDAALPVAAATRGVMAQAIAQGMGSDNITAVARLYP
jgi:3-hydroxyisobutyrate dehydrogenase-like beta-hydroxyacid dehydrogenase